MNPLYVTGLGPGKKEWLTLKAARLIKTADRVVRASQANRSRARIERWVKAGRQVVVVCEGDPLSHEMDGSFYTFLKRIKTPVVFVPGLHPALAACAEAGVVPTHRDRASAMVVSYARRMKPEAGTTFLYSRKKGFSISVGKRQASRFPN